ncbi:WecB/TagA/CpsF family glycosyltransferase [Alkalimonas collagenimarina]|uniref:WecB/TagA/CpsF family glycosyltransferase n=1 Tax=Alkalimonas collagenimarina TaxID=400390 RepID=A0ABT9H0A0_9GAMM|nr:WecB/TagA/CpsF family glycosyltransferase [Alkalimonas collagenimarina]MDP4536749.1 WecB/TagA/CpsF family glycosyltransferase [Alkalimonas collagenimarina]
MTKDNVDSVLIGPLQIGAYQDQQQLLETIVDQQGFVFAGSAIAINPEKIMTARQDSSVASMLQQAEIRYADGIGVVAVMRQRLKRPIQRIPGCELWQALMLRCAEFKVPVYLVGAKPEVLAQTKAKLQQQHVHVVGATDGYFGDEQQVIESIKQSGAQVISVAMGSPKQEQFIDRCKQQLPACFFMGVGGSYDVFTGNVKRAPAIWCKLHLEWAYRLLSQPSRVGRQGKLFHYLWLVLRGRL